MPQKAHGGIFELNRPPRFPSMLPAAATRPLARTATLATARATSALATRFQYSTSSHLHGHAGNKYDPAIPGDETGFLPGDKITGDTQIGSYPNLPMYNQQWRDGNASAGYWDRQDRRNFGETEATERRSSPTITTAPTWRDDPDSVQNELECKAAYRVPEEDEVLNIWSPDVWAFPASLGVKRLAAAALAFLGFGYLLTETRPEPHFERRSYSDGLLDALGVDASNEVMVAKRGARVASE
ncbi:hypothetical protein BGZ54_009391 [Gamsiella multidivaricata]|nr:hypothetical protein BGZ54_009391 [Gamsiella multidivaricata]